MVSAAGSGGWGVSVRVQKYRTERERQEAGYTSERMKPERWFVGLGDCSAGKFNPRIAHRHSHPKRDEKSGVLVIGQRESDNGGRPYFRLWRLGVRSLYYSQGGDG